MTEAAFPENYFSPNPQFYSQFLLFTSQSIDHIPPPLAQLLLLTAFQNGNKITINSIFFKLPILLGLKLPQVI